MKNTINAKLLYLKQVPIILCFQSDKKRSNVIINYQKSKTHIP